MIRWPYSLRKTEGVHYPLHLGGLNYRADCLMENLFIRKAKIPDCPLNKNKREEHITVSLTTFPKRAEQVFYSIKSLMLQSYPADEIILWLAREQFPNGEIPLNLRSLTEKGLTIRFCDDLRSHKKYFYALQEQTDNLVITYDDDIIYEKDSIEKLMKYHREFPDSVICNRGCEILFDETGKPVSPRNWKNHTVEGVHRPSFKVMASTGAGCLYPPKSVAQTAFDKALLATNAPTSDDIWMKFNTLAAGRGVVKTRMDCATLCTVYGSQEEKLTDVNIEEGQDDKALKNLLELFPGLMENASERAAVKSE